MSLFVPAVPADARCPGGVHVPPHTHNGPDWRTHIPRFLHSSWPGLKEACISVSHWDRRDKLLGRLPISTAPSLPLIHSAQVDLSKGKIQSITCLLYCYLSLLLSQWSLNTCKCSSSKSSMMWLHSVTSAFPSSHTDAWVIRGKEGRDTNGREFLK